MILPLGLSGTNIARTEIVKKNTMHKYFFYRCHGHHHRRHRFYTTFFSHAQILIYSNLSMFESNLVVHTAQSTERREIY